MLIPKLIDSVSFSLELLATPHNLVFLLEGQAVYRGNTDGTFIVLRPTYHTFALNTFFTVDNATSIIQITLMY